MARKIPNKPHTFVLNKDVPTKEGEVQFAEKYKVEEIEELMKKKIEKERAEKKAEQDKLDCIDAEKE